MARESPTLITAAQPSYDEQYRLRRRRYIIMMCARIPCLIAAAVLYQTPYLAIGCVLLSIPLPWMAVLIANDRPAVTTGRRALVRRRPRALHSGRRGQLTDEVR